MSNEAFADRNWKYWTEPEIIDMAGIPTAYRRKGSGETVVYLHGGGNTRAWLPFHEQLSQHVDLIAPEHPGFGDTPRGEDMDCWDDWVLHYDAFFRALDLTDFHLVGNSLGGWLAANLAIFYPERYKSLTLITPAGLRIEEAAFVDPFRWDEAEADQHLFNGRAQNFTEQLVQYGDFEDGIQAYKEETTAAILMFNPRYDIKLDTRLARVSAPTLVIGAEQDGVVGTEMAGRYAELIPGAEHLQLTGPDGLASSHMLFMEQSEATSAAIAAHVAKHA